MTPAELDEALARGAWVAPAKAPSPVHHVSQDLGAEACARVYAEREGLFDAQGQFYCRGCQQPTDWHVSLCCAPCRVESLRQRPERERRERERQRLAEQKAAAEPSGMQQRAERRVFR